MSIKYFRKKSAALVLYYTHRVHLKKIKLLSEGRVQMSQNTLHMYQYIRLANVHQVHHGRLC